MSILARPENNEIKAARHTRPVTPKMTVVLPYWIITLGIQYKRIKLEHNENEKNIKKVFALVCFSIARSRGTKKIKAKKAICVFGKANP